MSLPVAKTERDFSQIFSSRPSPKGGPTNVIFTLSSALQNIERATQHAEHQQQQQQQPPLQLSQQQEQDLRAAVTQASQSNAEPSSESQQAVMISLDELAKNFRPFHPPPPPVPINDMTEKQTSNFSNVIPTQQPPLDLPAAVVAEIMEDERSSITAPAPRQPFLNRLRKRQEEVMHAISVRRQRKLKMKKHKYKKLMRRTRNLRRRLDRI